MYEFIFVSKTDLKIVFISGQEKSSTQIWQISSLLENLFNKSFHFIIDGIKSIDLAFLSIMSQTGTACGLAMLNVNNPLVFSFLLKMLLG